MRPLGYEVGGLTADLRRLRTSVSELRQDVRRVDRRLFRCLLLELATLATLLAALVMTLVGVLAA